MKELLKSAINEAFGGCTPTEVFQRIIGAIIAICFIITCCFADSIGFGRVICLLIIYVVLWRFLRISSAFPKDEEEE